MLQVLVLCDDYWHPGEVIELGLARLSEEGFALRFVHAAKDILTPALLARYAVVINCKGNSVNAANRTPWFTDGAEVGPAELTAYVENGGGFISLHAGNTPREGEPYAELVGSWFIGHPPRCPVAVRVTAQHPVTAGVADFSVYDEHYAIELVAEDAEVLLRTASETGGDQVGGYVRTLGKGRLCALTPGHVLGVLENPEYQKLLANAIRWVAGVA